MTWAIFAIGWFNTGNYTHAQERFRRGFDPNVKPPFMVWQETLHGGCTPFLTGAGGFLQSVVFGTSGMRLKTDRLTFNPPPPSATGGAATSMSMLGFHFRGSTLNQVVTEDTVTYELASADASAPTLVLVEAGGASHPLVRGSPVMMPRTTAEIMVVG